MRCRATFVDRIGVMADVNPYEPPREPEPLTTGKVVKRTVGVVLILVLTLLAGFVTFFASCVVAISTTNPIYIPEPPPDAPPSSDAVFWSMTLIPTGIVMIAMLVWAYRVRRRKLNEHDRTQQARPI